MTDTFRLLLAGLIIAAATSPRVFAGAAWPSASMTDTAAIVATAGVGAAGEPATVPASAPMMSEAQLAAVRTWIVTELARFGRDDAFARSAASLLTPEDLAVLAANPKMMQPAGEMSAQMESFLWAALIIGGIVALVIAADSSSVHISA